MPSNEPPSGPAKTDGTGLYFSMLFATVGRRLLSIAAVAASIAAITTCATPPAQPFTLPEDPVFYLANYDFDRESRLIDRVTPIPEHVLLYLEALDDRPYTPYSPTTAELAMIESYIALLPPVHRQVLQERLVGM